MAKKFIIPAICILGVGIYFGSGVFSNSPEQASGLQSGTNGVVKEDALDVATNVAATRENQELSSAVHGTETNAKSSGGFIPSAHADIHEDSVAKALGRIKNVRPDMEFGPILESEVDGFFKTTIIDGPPIYVTPNGSHFIVGSVYEVGENEIIDLEEREMEGAREKEMAGLKSDDMIVFSPEGKTKAAVYVFTDADCYYCQKLHAEMAEINALGIEVRYLAYPRKGPGSDSYRKIASAWCADDPNQALTEIKAGRDIVDNVCAGNPVTAQYELGGRVGVRGTPALITENGKLLPGYRPAATLAKILDVQ